MRSVRMPFICYGGKSRKFSRECSIDKVVPVTLTQYGAKGRVEQIKSRLQNLSHFITVVI